MDIIKYFYEEPTLLETLTPDTDPDARRQHGRSGEDRASLPDAEALDAFLATADYYRGYLAGGTADTTRVGLTAVDDPAAFVAPLVDALEETWWGGVYDDGAFAALDGAGVRQALRDPDGLRILVTAPAPLAPAALAKAAAGRRRRTLPALRALLDAGAVAFFPVRAHDGFDWSIFAAHPLRKKLTAAFKQYPSEHVRRFILPYQKARAEHKFYFDQWQIGTSPLPTYIEEV